MILYFGFDYYQSFSNRRTVAEILEEYYGVCFEIIGVLFKFDSFVLMQVFDEQVSLLSPNFTFDYYREFSQSSYYRRAVE